jgi:hypothetical protein
MTLCSNPECPQHTAEGYKGGKFKLVGGKWYCTGCAEWAGGTPNPAKNLWDFTTTHLNGRPVHIRSLAHMRQLEKQYGVSNHAANYDQAKW